MADYEVYVTTDAEADLEEIADFIEQQDSASRADAVYEGIKQAVLKLETAPKRGRVVPELLRVGVTRYREVFFKPYRILYFVSGKRVYVHAIFDERRRAEEVLSRRLLR